MSRRSWQAARESNLGPDPGHGCREPDRCANPRCAPPVAIQLVPPGQARMVVRQLPGWPMSASALLDLLRERITRAHLVDIAGSDPFGAAGHFPILVKIWVSGRVPAPLRFDPGEALRLNRWSAGPDVDHLSRAFCCTLLCISPDESDWQDDPASITAPLVDSCLALGGGAPGLAEQLLAWRAVSEPPWIAGLPGGHSRPDPVLLLALVVLRAVADPGDARLADLARTVAGALTRQDTLAWEPGFPASVSGMMNGQHASIWQRLVTTHLAPLRPASQDIDRLTAALLDCQPHLCVHYSYRYGLAPRDMAILSLSGVMRLREITFAAGGRRTARGCASRRRRSGCATGRRPSGRCGGGRRARSLPRHRGGLPAVPPGRLTTRGITGRRRQAAMSSTRAAWSLPACCWPTPRGDGDRGPAFPAAGAGQRPGSPACAGFPAGPR